jgi:RNA polymerase sigma-70 factor (ECF subfamily)
MRNLFYNQAKREKRYVHKEVEVLSEVCLENDLEVQNALERVQEALDGINEGYAQVVYAVCVLGMSYREASDCLNVPMGTIMSRLNRARKEIRDAKE